MTSAKNDSLQDQANALCVSRGWTCLTPVLNGFGAWGMLHWHCKDGHRFDVSLQGARNLDECPHCRQSRIAARNTKASPAPTATWNPIPIPELAPTEVPPASRRGKGSGSQKPTKPPKSRRDVNRSGVIG